MGATWIHMSVLSWTQNPLDWEVFVRRSVDNSIITKCDFEDDSKPLCDWSQVSADDGDWIRTSGPSPTGISGPPGGYPTGEGYYLHMDSRTFRTGGVARLRSPDIWEHGPLCLYFAYHMFGLSWGAQLRLLLLMGTQDNRPKVLWKHVNTQSPSWMPTTVTLPAELILPSRLIFEGMRGNTPFLDISLDALSIHRGTCNRVCMMKMCTFDTLNDLCGWSWIPTPTGAKWVQKNGSSGKTGVGPEDDFSSPGHGFYMLLDPKNAKPGQKSVLLSPLSQSDGCLTLSFNYILWGHSLDAALLVYASLLGSIRKHTIFSGQPGPTWKPVSVNYTGQGQIQFTMVGIFGIIPEPAVAVDAISIAPCGESVPHCDFEDSAHPFCDWSHVFSDGGHWAWGSKNLPTIVGGSKDSTYEGEHYIYFEADKFSRAGQSVRLGSRPFCAPGDICVEFAYHMNGLGKGSMLKLLLGSPAGSSPITLWHRVGAQGPGWLNSSVTVPSGYQQPMQLFFEATRGSNSAFLVAVRFIKISHRLCGVVTTTAVPTLTMVSTGPIVPPHEPSTTMIPSGEPTVPAEEPVVLTEKPTFSTEKPTLPIEKPLVTTEKPAIPTEGAMVPAQMTTISPAEAAPAPAEVTTEAATFPVESTTEPATVPVGSTTQPALFPAGFTPETAATFPAGSTTEPVKFPAGSTMEAAATFPAGSTMESAIFPAGPTIAAEATVPAESTTETVMFPTGSTMEAAATFPGGSTTEIVMFPAEPSMVSEATFPGESTLETTTFPAGLTTGPAMFPAGPTVVETATFSGGFSPEAATFSGGPTTEPAMFPAAPTVVETATFSGGSSPEAATFSGGPTTEPAMFPAAPTVVETATFSGGSSPEAATFSGGPTTEPAMFPAAPTVVETATFSGGSSPEAATFSGGPTTEPAMFPAGPTVVETATFSGGSSPEAATFSGGPTTEPAMFPAGPTVIAEATFPGGSTPEAATFPGGPTTEPAMFPTGPTVVAEATFPGGSTLETTTFPAGLTTEPAMFPAGPTVVETATFPGGSSPEAATFPGGSTKEPAIFPARPTVVVEATFPGGSSPEAATFPGGPTTEPAMFPAGPTVVAETTYPGGSSPEAATIPAGLPTETASVSVQLTTEQVPAPVPAEVASEATNILFKTTTTTGTVTVLLGATTVTSTFPTQTVTEAATVPMGVTTEMTTVPMGTTPEMTMVPTEATTETTTFPTQAVTESTTVPPEVPMVPVEAATEKPAVLTEKPTLPTLTPTVPTEQPTVPPEKPTVPPEKPMIPTEKPMIPTEKPMVPPEKPMIPTEKPMVPTEKPMVPTEKPMIPTEQPMVPTEKPTVPTEKPMIPTEKPMIPTEKPMIPTEQPMVPTEKPMVPTEKPTIPTEKPMVPTEKPTAPSQKPTIPTKKPTVPTQKPTIPTKKPTVPTQKPTIPTKKPTVPTQKATLPTQSTVWASGTSQAPSTTRNATLTTVSCPPNAHYEPCMCPASCENPKPTCEPHCSPGCICNQGFLFSQNNCISALSCHCFYSNRYYQPGEEWFNSNCSERCRCSSGGQIECQKAQCKANMVCELRDHKHGCYPFGSATCVVYGALHYVTFDERHIGFTGRCTYILTQSCHNKTTEPFFRVTAENEKRALEGVSCLSKVYVALSETSITLLKGRRILVGNEHVDLPVMLSNDTYMTLSGRFIVLQTPFGLTVRWDGDQQLFVTVTSTHAGHLCGLCGNYDGESGNDYLKPDGSPAQDAEELGHSWQVAHNESKECEKRNETVAVCAPEVLTTLSGPAFCGQLTLPDGIFETCLNRLKATSFFDNCVSDMCSFQGVQTMLCAHISTLTAICQSAGLPVRPWRESSFCPLACPPNSRYSLCAKPCPETCQAKLTQKPCPYPCVEACECNPGFILSGSQCVHRSQCGCLTSSGRYLKLGDVWYKPNCKEICVCGSNHKIRCHAWNCTAQETCRWKDGSYGCHALSAGTCLVSGDPHYLTFDGALHHFTGTCNYILSKPCWPGFQDNYFVVSASNENRGGSLEVSYIKAVHLVVFDLRISLFKGYKVTVEGREVALPVWLFQDRVTIRFSGSFILFHTDFGLQVRYDGNHLVMVSVPSSYTGRLCGMCGNYNNNSLDDNLKPDKRPASNSSQLGASWRIAESSDPGCFVTGSSPVNCQDTSSSTIWNKNCGILLNPMGPFSSCHLMVSPQPSFASCVHSQCESKGNALSLCHSLQAYASLCAQAGQAVAWRNNTFCPLKCLPNSSYKPCANPCPDACLSLNSPTYCPVLPCVEGCECQRGYILSGHSCVPPSYCGCRDPEGFYHMVGESWYPEKTCRVLCNCWIRNNITCGPAACEDSQMCSSQDGLFHCQTIGTGVCHVSEEVRYVSFDGVGQPIFGTCTHILVKVCDPSSKLPFFEISAKSESQEGKPFRIFRVYITVFSYQITLQKGHSVMVNDEPVTLPTNSKIHGVKITSSGDYTLVNIKNGVQVKYGGDHFLEIKVPAAYHKKLCGVCGNFNGQKEDDLMMPNNELAEEAHDFMDSWQNHDIDPTCQAPEEFTQVEVEETTHEKCRPADLGKARQACQEALQTPAWAECATRVDVKPYILGCIDKLCESGGRSGGLVHTLCETLQGFESACRNEGLKTPIWRNSSFCPLECPVNSRYSNCLPSCTPSCRELDCESAAVRVPLTCTEGCICQTDYVLNEGQCVPKSSCDCRTAEGAVIAVNKTWISSGCTQKCMCSEGRVQCRSFQCPYGSHCQHGENDNSFCAADKSDQCTILGDPYYRTFDRFGYHFPGQMTYILVKTVESLPEGLESLLVEGRNKLTKSSSPTLYEVIIMVYGYKVQLQTNLELVVNDQKMSIPYTPTEELEVTLRGTRIFLITAFQLIVSYDGKNLAVINLPSTYQGLVRGLCGNYDRDRTNDFMLPSGRVTQNIHVFISSWTVNPQDSLLRFPRALPEQEEGEEKDVPAIQSQCSPEQLTLIHASQACRVLVDPQGPFATCHQIIDPEPFQEHCVFDLCAGQDPQEQEELRCRALSGYAIICQEAGASLVSWRNHTRCAMVCPANTVYKSCMTPCLASCANPAAARGCEGPCLEGCASLPGHIYSGTRSLPKARCGCTAAGIYYQLGDSFVTEDCAQHCTCASSGLLLCEPFGCSAGEICTLANFTRGCFRESLCLRNPCHNDGRCREQGASFTCECDPGYGGRLCTEPWDILVPQKPEPSSFVAVLLGMLVPVVVILPVLVAVATRECVHRMRRQPWRREKPRSPEGWLVDRGNVPEPAFKAMPF
ncbi:zonadhesin [Dipodomys merriami]|uniref:zonadhesin n=1 Tax=Dipodomys merriami TaxID=94247 RepID=UPI00385595C0